MSQIALAAEANTTPATISDIENRDGNPTLETLQSWRMRSASKVATCLQSRSEGAEGRSAFPRAASLTLLGLPYDGFYNLRSFAKCGAHKYIPHRTICG